MPSPVASDVHVDRPLTNISIAYMQSATGFVADRVFPNIPVAKQSDKYFKYDRSDFWRNQFKKRAVSTESAGGGWKLSTDSYFAEVWALHKDIDDRIRANEDAPLSMDRDATLWLAQQAMINREVQWNTDFFTTGVWTGISGSAADVTGVAASPSTNEVLQWNDASSTPIDDVKTYKTTSQILTGMRPNTLVMGRQVWDELSEHPDLVDRIKYSGGVSPAQPAVVSLQAAASLFELDRILVSDAIQVTSSENPTFETSMTRALIAGKAALLAYVNPTPSIMQPSAGYTFSWTGYTGAGGMGQRTSSMRMEHLKSDRIETEQAFDQKVVCTDCGVFFTSIVA